MADGQSEGAGPGEGETSPGDGRRAGPAGAAPAASAGGASADGDGRDSDRARGLVAGGREQPDADRTDAAADGPGTDRSVPEPAAPEERQDEAEGAVRRDRPPSEWKLDEAATGIPALGDRLRSLGVPGWTRRDTEWLALVCLQGGGFLRPQHLAFLGQSPPELARRFVRRCGKAAVEERWNASGLKLCRIVDREL